MYKLTERRLNKARSILDEHKSILDTHGTIDVGAFEMSLRECWNLGYQELKDIIIALSKLDDYVYLAAYFMEHSNAPGVVSEFKRPLAKLYGITHYSSPNRESAQRDFWAKKS